jgi:hypothetical protein
MGHGAEEGPLREDLRPSRCGVLVGLGKPPISNLPIVGFIQLNIGASPLIIDIHPALSPIEGIPIDIRPSIGVTLGTRGIGVADVDAKVMKFVEETLKKAPKIELEDLFERAKKVSDSMGMLSKRQFNARYPLQVKRRAAQGKRPKAKAEKAPAKPRVRRPAAAAEAQAHPEPTPASDRSRQNVRKVLLQFATDIAGAEERKALVKVLAGVDRYVDQVLKGVAKG